MGFLHWAAAVKWKAATVEEKRLNRAESCESHIITVYSKLAYFDNDYSEWNGLPVGLDEDTIFKVDMISIQCFDHYMAPQLHGHVQVTSQILPGFKAKFQESRKEHTVWQES